jgi:hypothetical protein
MITYPGGETVVVEGRSPGEAGYAVVYDISTVKMTSNMEC